jgi:ribose transport system ATP-binding protein/rhamnose transport system ATP-binding protein
VFCFDLVANERADTGIDADQFPLTGETAIPIALARVQPGASVVDGALKSVLFKLTNQSGHSFGYLGLTVPAPDALPDPESIRAMILNSMADHGVGQLLIAKQTEENTA